ncbi:MAG: ribokinase, partial [Gorillibacterium sp.]|nr:ribokinase [Gorillibacterium sp.]
LVLSMDRLPKQGETVQGKAIHYVPGGKGANQAVGCARLMAATTMIGCVGDDDFGKAMIKSLQINKVDVAAVVVKEAISSGIAVISHSPEDNSIVIIEGANGSCNEDFVHPYAAQIAEADVLIVQLETPLSGVQEALAIAKRAGVTTILNPAPARLLDDKLLRLADYLTPNETEWDSLSGTENKGEQELCASICAWESKYTSKVIVTRGKEGCSYVEHGMLKTIPTPRVKVVDTTGAGDCFNAAFACAIAQKQPLGEAVNWAVGCASLSVQRFGAQAGMPTLEEALSHNIKHDNH